MVSSFSVAAARLEQYRSMLRRKRHFEILNRIGVRISYCQCSNNIKWMQGRRRPFNK